MAHARNGRSGTHGIEHVIVLMLENRSFDHLLGYHPRVGTLHMQPESCPTTSDSANRVETTSDARPSLPVGPAHSHEEVMRQVTGTPVPKNAQSSYSVPVPAPMNGFIESYRRLEDAGSGREIMRCFPPENAPVLSHLASEFVVFDRWFASVPGETWPNRNFAHAGTSGGEVNINARRRYEDETIFDRLDGDWAVYHKGLPQIWAFRHLLKRNRRRFRGLGHLINDIEDDNLRAYSFVEPDHGLLPGEQGNSQHPNENEESGRSFVAGEQLIARIYNALVEKPGVFDKTLFLITYDEHGGFFDHVPPVHVEPPTTIVTSGFDFAVSGVRVPAVAVNPRLALQTVSVEVDHTAIPKTVRTLFAPQSAPLGNREARSPNLIDLMAWGPRRTCAPVPVPELPETRWLFPTAEVEEPLDDFQRSLVELAVVLQDELDQPRARGVAPDAVLLPSPLELAAKDGIMTVQAGEQLTSLVAALQDDY